jgi:hypothetical protein
VFTRTIDDPDLRPGTLDITTQVGPALTGRATLTGRSVPVAGTITSAGAVTLSGVDGLGVLTIRARIPDLTTGGILQPCVLEGRVTSLTGAGVQGDLVAVHQVPVSGAPSIGGDWAGVMIQDAGDDRPTPVRASFTQTPTGALTGRMFNPQPDPPGFRLTLAGQVAWDDPDLRPGYLLIGASPEVLATAILHPAGVDNPDLRGPVRLLSADGTVARATLQLDRVTR